MLTRRHAWLPVLVLGVVLFLVDERTMVDTNNPNLVPSVILLGSAAVPSAFLAYVYGRRLPFRLPGGLVAIAGLLGGVIGTVVAGTLEFETIQRDGGLPLLGIGVIEEGSKLLVPLALAYLFPFRRMADGLLVGVACGAGFAALETMGYAFVELAKTRGDVTDTADLLLQRGLLSPAGHMAWTGLTAAALFAAVGASWRARQAWRFLAAFGVAVVLHACWDGAGSLRAYEVLAVLGLGMLALTARAAAREPGASDPAPRPPSETPPSETPPRGRPRADQFRADRAGAGLSGAGGPGAG